MALALYRLGRWCAAHAKVVLALWLVALVVAGAAAASLGRPVTSEVTIPGSQFEAVQSDLQREIPDASGGFAAVVVRSEDGDALDRREAGDGAETVVLRDPAAGIYRKFVLREGRLAGCVLVGDTAGALFYLGLIRSQQDITPIRADLPFGEAYCARAA